MLVDPGNLVQSSVTVPEGLRVEDTIEPLAKETDIPVATVRAGARATRSRSGCRRTPRGTRRATSSPRPTPSRRTPTPTDMLSAMVDRWQQAADEADLEERAEELGYTPAS